MQIKFFMSIPETQFCEYLSSILSAWFHLFLYLALFLSVFQKVPFFTVGINKCIYVNVMLSLCEWWRCICGSRCVCVCVGQIMTFGVKLYHFLPYSFESLTEPWAKLMIGKHTPPCFPFTSKYWSDWWALPHLTSVGVLGFKLRSNCLYSKHS